MKGIWPTMILMACITFYCRYAMFTQLVSFEFSDRVKKVLAYTAPTVMTSMWAPIVFLGGQSDEGFQFINPYLIAGLLTIVVSLVANNTLLIVLSGLSAFGLLKFLLL